MPGGKRRLKQLFTTGLQVSANGQFLTELLAGSVTVTAGSVSAASSTSAYATVANLTASHRLLVTAASNISGSLALLGATPGAGSLLAHVACITGCPTAASNAFTAYYLAWLVS